MSEDRFAVITLECPDKSFYLSAGPVFYSACGKIETFVAFTPEPFLLKLLVFCPV